MVNTHRQESAQALDFAAIAAAAARLVDDMLAYNTDTSRSTARMFEALASKMAEFAGDTAAWPAAEDGPRCGQAADAAAVSAQDAQDALHADAERRAAEATDRIKNPMRRWEAEAMIERIEGHDFEAIEAAVKHIEELAAIDTEDHA